MAHDGDLTLQKEPLDASPSGNIRFALAAEPVQSDKIFLYHKTTNRKVYDLARSTGRQESDDVLLWNEHGEITETTIANVVLKIDGKLYTPPVSCGLLPGTYRQSLIQKGKLREKIISVSMLKECEKIFLINSVSLWREAEIIE